MPIDPSRLPALRQELIYANSVSAGGQEPDPGRVAAIEEEIRIHEAALAAQPEPEVESEPEPEVETADAAPAPEDAAPDAGTETTVADEAPEKA